MIEEAYVSFEVAKLLKEKGFKELCRYYYLSSGNIHRVYGLKDRNYASVNTFSAPTLQMAMRWLREVHNIGIFPSTYTITNSKGSKEEHVYGSAIVNLITFDLMCDDIMPRNSYEEACEAAIKYCLENLI